MVQLANSGCDALRRVFRGRFRQRTLESAVEPSGVHFLLWRKLCTTGSTAPELLPKYPSLEVHVLPYLHLWIIVYHAMNELASDTPTWSPEVHAALDVLTQGLFMGVHT